MKKFKPMKVKNSSIKLPDEFLDHFLINEGDYIALIEENGKFYLRKTRESPDSEPEESEPEKTSNDPQIPPKTFDEIMKEAQKQFAGGEMLPDDIMKTLQDTLKDPEMMKKIQDMTMSFFKGFSIDPSSTKSGPEEKSSSKKKTQPKDEDDDDDKENGFKIDIE